MVERRVKHESGIDEEDEEIAKGEAGRDAEIEDVCEGRAQDPHPTWDARRYAARGRPLDVGSGSGAWGDDEGRALSLTGLTFFAFDTIVRNVDQRGYCRTRGRVSRTRATVRGRSVVEPSARSCARLGMKEEAVEDLGMLEQVDKGTWESQDDVNCEKAKQNDIDMKYEGGGIDKLRRVGHGGRTDALISKAKARR